MIITSNSVQHEYTIPQVTIVGEVGSLENVAEKVQIYLHSSVTFDHTYEKSTYDQSTASDVLTTVTESKTLTEFTQYFVDLDTTSLDSDTFSAWDDLEEDTVLGWAFAADADTKASVQTAQEAKVLEAKDKILNPRKYQRDTPVTPWRRRADEAAAEGI